MNLLLKNVSKQFSFIAHCYHRGFNWSFVLIGFPLVSHSSWFTSYSSIALFVNHHLSRNPISTILSRSKIKRSHQPKFDELCKKPGFSASAIYFIKAFFLTFEQYVRVAYRKVFTPCFDMPEVSVVVIPPNDTKYTQVPITECSGILCSYNFKLKYNDYFLSCNIFTSSSVFCAGSPKI